MPADHKSACKKKNEASKLKAKKLASNKGRKTAINQVAGMSATSDTGKPETISKNSWN